MAAGITVAVAPGRACRLSTSSSYGGEDPCHARELRGGGLNAIGERIANHLAEALMVEASVGSLGSGYGFGFGVDLAMDTTDSCMRDSQGDGANRILGKTILEELGRNTFRANELEEEQGTDEGSKDGERHDTK